MLYGLLTAPASLPAEQVFLRVLKIREGYYGTKHRLTLMTLNYLACVFRDQQRFDQVGVTVGWGGHEGKRGGGEMREVESGRGDVDTWYLRYHEPYFLFPPLVPNSLSPVPFPRFLCMTPHPLLPGRGDVDARPEDRRGGAREGELRVHEDDAEYSFRQAHRRRRGRRRGRGWCAKQRVDHG